MLETGCLSSIYVKVLFVVIIIISILYLIQYQIPSKDKYIGYLVILVLVLLLIALVYNYNMGYKPVYEVLIVFASFLVISFLLLIPLLKSDFKEVGNNIYFFVSVLIVMSLIVALYVRYFNDKYGY